MENKNYTATFVVNQKPNEVFNAICNVRGWWSEALEGGSEKLNDEFIYRHGDLHYSKHKLVEVVPGKKVVWLTTDSNLSFIKDKTEWNGTHIIFDITDEGDKTKMVFTHDGLVPQIECFGACSGGWSHYLNKSLLPLITTGVGKPDKKES